VPVTRPAQVGRPHEMIIAGRLACDNVRSAVMHRSRAYLVEPWPSPELGPAACVGGISDEIPPSDPRYCDTPVRPSLWYVKT